MLGRAMRSDRLDETLLPKRIALPVFASDALSSNAYATQEMLVVLALGGATLFTLGPFLALGVVLVFVVVVSSYRQNVRAYPNGGGDYEVVSENLGPKAGVVVASALFVDYVLTVAVSISAAIDNLASIWPFFADYRVGAALVVIGIVALLNMRGIRETGVFFAIPAYLFIVSVAIMFFSAIVQLVGGSDMRAPSADFQIVEQSEFVGFALIFLLARAFSSGTTALTGVEAISNGVPAFRKPKSRNAATTLSLLAVISMSMFLAVTWLALITQVKVAESDSDLIGLPAGQSQQTVVVQIAEAVFSGSGLMVALISIATAAILMVAANTAFSAFPVLGSVLARDGYLPRQLHTRGDRLAFSNGIFVLALLAGVLVVVFGADVTALIQLYIIGVFFSFTLTQWGMVRHWAQRIRRSKDSRERTSMRRSQLINRVGAGLTGLVFLIVLISKFSRGAWIVVLAVPLLYLLMQAIKHHYDQVKIELSPEATDDAVTLPSRVVALVLVSKIHKPTLRALAYARASRPAVLEAVTVNVDPEESAKLQQEWDRRDLPVALRTLDSPYREVTRPIVDYVRLLRRESPRDLVAVYIPQYVVGHWWEQILHNQSALRLRTRLMFSRNVVVVTVPWQLESSQDRAEAPNSPLRARCGAATHSPARRRRASTLTNPDPAGAEPAPLRVGDELEVEVGRVAHGGHCVARHNNQVIFVRHTLPGERVRLRITSLGRKNRFANADAIAVLRAASGRVPASCQYSGPDGCGGCDWQHVDLPTQRKLKTMVLSEQLQRFADWTWSGQVEPVTSTETGRNWRTRMQYSIDNAGRAGLRKFHEQVVVPIDVCEIASQRVQDATCDGTRVTAVRWDQDRVVVVDPSHGDPVVVPCGEPPSQVSQTAAGLKFAVPTTGFWQVHPGAADALARIVVDWVGDAARVWDLYAGVGLFAGAIAVAAEPDVREIVAVESDRGAVAAARANLAPWPQVTAVKANVRQWLAGLTADQLRVDSVVLDPPRKGAGAVVLHRLTESTATQIVYVACDPAALGRDTQWLLANGWRLLEVRALDLFPMTHHFESLARFCR